MGPLLGVARFDPCGLACGHDALLLVNNVVVQHTGNC